MFMKSETILSLLPIYQRHKVYIDEANYEGNLLSCSLKLEEDEGNGEGIYI